MVEGLGFGRHMEWVAGFERDRQRDTEREREPERESQGKRESACGRGFVAGFLEVQSHRLWAS